LLNRSRDELIPNLVRLASIAEAYNRGLADFPFWKSCLCLHAGIIRRQPWRRYGVLTPSEI
jgi:hypothetical protein